MESVGFNDSNVTGDWQLTTAWIMDVDQIE